MATPHTGVYAPPTYPGAYTPPATVNVRRVPRSNNVTTVGGVGSPITVPYVPPVIRAEDRPTQTTGFEMPVADTQLTNINPYGGTTYGGGGGGGTKPPDYSQWGAWAAQAKPGMYDFTPLEQNYLGWDPAMFDRADQGITSGIADARKRGGTAFDLAAQPYQNYQDPYASGPKAFNPGVDPALMRSMEAWGGAGSGEAMRQNNYANTADAGMGNIYDLLGNVGRQYNADNLAAVGGDRMQFDQGLDMAGNTLQLSSDMARARAHGDWRTRDNDARNMTAMANWGRRNQVGDTNVSTTNQWNTDVLDAILSMIGSGGKNIPKAGGDPSIMMPQYRSA